MTAHTVVNVQETKPGEAPLPIHKTVLAHTSFLSLLSLKLNTGKMRKILEKKRSIGQRRETGNPHRDT